MAIKKVVRVVAPKAPHFVGDGFRVSNFIPSVPDLHMARMSPFILLDYASKYRFTPSPQDPRGVGVHPHRGFETVTIAYKGSVSHHDSSGGSGTIYEGDVQWMTAASGVLHKEYHSEEFNRNGGEFQMIQLWVNLPAKDKMSPPKYQAISADQIPQFVLPDQAGTVDVIAGEFEGVKGAATTFTPLHMMNARVVNGSTLSFHFPANYNTLMLVVEGSIRVNDQADIPTDHLVFFENEGEDIVVEATKDTVVLVLSGEPIDEPIASHGPFVMNTQEEIQQAFRDFQSGKFGTLA